MNKHRMYLHSKIGEPSSKYAYGQGVLDADLLTHKVKRETCIMEIKVAIEKSGYSPAEAHQLFMDIIHDWFDEGLDIGL